MTKILLVEDDKSLREIYGVRLLAEGYDIISAGDGEEALAMAIKDRPALIVSDVMMPKISGFDMLDILRSTTETRSIKVIMMTALSSDDQRTRGEQLGADRYLVKSQVGIEDVVRAVHEVLGDAPMAAGATPAPTASSAPSGQSRSTMQPPARPAATPQPAPTPPSSQPVDSSLPQPTAPFSTPRPGSLADRVIEPLERPENPATPVHELMDQELASEPSTDTPAIGDTPVAQPTPAPVASIPVSDESSSSQDATIDTSIPPIPASASEGDLPEQQQPQTPPTAPTPQTTPPTPPQPTA